MNLEAVNDNRVVNDARTIRVTYLNDGFSAFILVQSDLRVDLCKIVIARLRHELFNDEALEDIDLIVVQHTKTSSGIVVTATEDFGHERFVHLIQTIFDGYHGKVGICVTFANQPVSPSEVTHGTPASAP